MRFLLATAAAASMHETLLADSREGADQRLRPKAMTLAVLMGGLLPILQGSCTGSEVMTQIAAPMVGGMATAPLLSMLVISAAWHLLHRRDRRQKSPTQCLPALRFVNPPIFTPKES